jgi:hypothetical protein
MIKHPRRNKMTKVPSKLQTVSAFFKELEAKKDSIELEGFLERADDDEGKVKVALFGDCKRWILLPSDALADIEILRKDAVCVTEKEGFHTHPYVRFTVDSSNREAARILTELAVSVIRRPMPLTRSSTRTAEFNVGSVGSYARRSSARPTLFDLVTQRRAAQPFEWPVDHCEYNENVCGFPHCVCVNYQHEHAWCCDCCVA